MPFPSSPRVVYENNPLAEVVCQLRFPTILEIGTTDPAEFQKKIRDKYPLYEKKVSLQAPAAIVEFLSKLPIQMPPESFTYKFLQDSRDRFISLDNQLIALTEKCYTTWEDFFPDLMMAVRVLQDVYHPAYHSRIGLRYVDVIDKAKLGLQDEGWQALIKPNILGMIGTEELARYVKEFQNVAVLALDDVPEGKVRIFHGTVRTVKDSGDWVYVFDADFYMEGKVKYEDVEAILGKFNRHAGNLFRWSITERLHNALKPRPG